MLQRLVSSVFRWAPVAKPHVSKAVDTNAGAIRVKRAVVVKICGGLANQMICYKLGRYLAETQNRTLILDVSWYADQPAQSNRNLQLLHFNIQFDILTYTSSLVAELSKGMSTCYLCGEEFHEFSEQVVHVMAKSRAIQPCEILLCDLWGALALRNDADAFAVESGVLEEFTIDKKKAYTALDFEWQDRIDLSANSVAVHVRRGDFATHAGNLLLTDVYFNNSIRTLAKELPDATFFVFSDDIDWCKENIHTEAQIFFMDFNDERSGYKDLVLAASCKHFILSNLSTFSHQILQLNRPHPSRRIIRSTSADLLRNGRQ